jgi:hypothetical protein
MMKKFLVIVPLALAVVGCSSTPTETSNIVGPKSERMKNEVSYPAWYTKTPSDEALYAVASEYSKDMQFAVDKSMLSAKRELASNFSSYVSSMMKDYSMEAGELNSTVIREIDRTAKMIVSRVNMIGVQRTNLAVVHETGGFRAFVRVRYSVDDTNRILLAEIKRNKQLLARVQASKSFKELEESVNQIREDEKNAQPVLE